MKNKMKLLIGYDGSACADAALEDLRKAGLPRQCEVSLISAVDIFLPSGKETWMSESVKATIKRYRAEAKALMRQAEMNAKEAKKKMQTQFPNWKVRSKAVADSPAWALVKDAESWKHDLVVVGAHGHSKLGRFLGSVSQMVLTQAECPVRVGRVSQNPKDKKYGFLSELMVHRIRRRQFKPRPKGLGLRADCIFVGARGLTHLKRFFMGGVSTAVAARAPCSVEVVRPWLKKMETLSQ